MPPAFVFSLRSAWRRRNDGATKGRRYFPAWTRSLPQLHFPGFWLTVL